MSLFIFGFSLSTSSHRLQSRFPALPCVNDWSTECAKNCTIQKCAKKNHFWLSPRRPTLSQITACQDLCTTFLHMTWLLSVNVHYLKIEMIDQLCKNLYNSKMCKNCSLLAFASPPYPLHHLPAHDVIIIGQRSSNRHLVLSRSHIIKFFKSHITPLLIWLFRQIHYLKIERIERMCKKLSH